MPEVIGKKEFTGGSKKEYLEMRELFFILIIVMVSRLNTFVKIHKTVLQETVKFTIFKLKVFK